LELSPTFKRVIGLDVHQAPITDCTIVAQTDGMAVIDARHNVIFCDEPALYAFLQSQCQAFG
jgi:hypothetical protein